ncbi:LysR family transcriptional regulator [Mesorhizobium sp. B2-2-4]|uniref:LysR family transcriptional regulator n=1 Tax=unclassified Mesorhizobium TaxID=325217 RepID=UPI0011283289|nr:MULTISPECIES: LysR family transcriptional regulator [unclassified Mesorhizobium]TPM57448.1 LysR family transcriptional regulator [Mesorhizobium sp. B2-2-4]TPM65748.1 LysR family transcriptional regulator [Mesorhizobium sp. B2-2-1]TPN64205.1 LysR family transcriptional regulator [Mesorhizobium sp. B1-1-1]TPN72074.1 LysR family transcriptional regulator [Mesorhizobium sp. B1-1-3]
MRRGDFSELAVFIAVAEAGSFTRAAAKLGLSQSALSYAVRTLEQRLGVRLISRTTRSLSVTVAGERLLRSLRPAFDHIESEIAAVTALRDKPTGLIRLTTFRYAAKSVLWPVLAKLLLEYPDIEVELSLDEGLVDIVASKFDAGIRIGEQVQKDMVAIRIGPDLRMAVVGSPSYFANRTVPKTPRELGEHRGISYRQKTGGGLFAWEFEKGGEELEVRMNGPLVINDGEMLEAAALDGLGLAYTFESQVAPFIADGRLIRVLEDWCQPFSGYHLYYPSRRQHTAAFALLVEALRLKA